MSTKSRRQFFKFSGLAAAAGLLRNQPLNAQTVTADSKSPSPVAFQLGLASYTTREFDIDQTIQMAHRLDLKYLCLNPKHLPLESTSEYIQLVRNKVESAGLTLYAAGVVDMLKPAQIDRAFEYAKTAGLNVIVIYTTADVLPAIEKKVIQYDIPIAIHNHGPEGGDFPTLLEGFNRIKNMDRRMGLCMDVGHVVRFGADPISQIFTCRDRLLDVHLKDENRADKTGTPLEVGRGVTNIPSVFAALKEIGYNRIVALEYEKDGEDPMPGMAESIGFARAVIKTITL